MYFIHNKYNRKSIEMLKTIPRDCIVIDYYTEKENGNTQYDYLMVESIPCLLEELRYSDGAPSTRIMGERNNMEEMLLLILNNQTTIMNRINELSVRVEGLYE